MKKKCSFEPISITSIILFSVLFGIVGAGKLENLSGNEILKEKPAWANPRIKEKNHEDKLINAFDCMDDTLPSTQIFLRPPKKCEVSDGSAYESGQRKKAQILERLDLITINITTCVVQFYVNVGWCGGEFAFENFMHQDLNTLRSQIIVPELDCMQAELDGTIKLSTPEYGSIEGLDLKLELNGGRGLAMFQPIGFSRPDSWCRGSTFYPPRNNDKSIQYLDYSSHFEKKKMWGTEKIRRAVVTYNLEATVEKTEGFITSSGDRVIIPNKLEISRKRNLRREKIIDRNHYRNVGMRNNINMLEAYQDLAYGTVVFNISGLPRNECEAFRSISRIDDGELLQSKLEKFAILKYSQGEDNVAITLNKNTRICGKKMYETKKRTFLWC